MSTLRVSNIEAKADASSPTIDEKVKVTSSQGRVLVQIDGKTAGITSIGINTTSTSFTIDGNQNVQFVGVITAANVNTTGVSTFTSLNVAGQSTLTNVNVSGVSTNARLNVGTGGTVITTSASGLVGVGTTNPTQQLHVNGDSRIDSGGYALIVLGNNSSNSFYITKEISDNSLNIWSGTTGSGTSRLRIDSSGRILNSPAQPYFYATGPGSTTTLGNLADLNFSSAIVNNGNHYNTSTFRFTVPVAGRYLFTWSVFIINVAGRCSIKVNGTGYNGLQMDVGAGMSQSVILQLNANDYVTVGDWQSISGGAFFMGHAHFSGLLLG